jgi:uncharacterized protein YeeX (DUF496 family)
MDVSYNESVRFFSCVLITIDQLDGYICRDEMILGPMCVNDTSPTEFAKMIQYIKETRGNYKKLQSDLEHLAKSLRDNKKDGMTVTSVQNCTRFPISVLKYCDWVSDDYKNLYGKRIKFMRLTEHGRETVEKLKTFRDIRLSDYEKSTPQQKQALIRLGTYQMLGRAHFDLSTVADSIDKDQAECESISKKKELLFSPYQTLEYDVVNDAMHISVGSQHLSDASAHLSRNVGRYQRRLSIDPNAQMISLDRSATIVNGFETQNVHDYVLHIQSLYEQIGDTSALVNKIVQEHVGDKKDEFYPFVETLFRIIGVDCRKSRDGVNGERWDAMICDPQRSIPIEIKSPTEEMHISVKAIRQALENKIVLLSRKTYITTHECSTYAVGYLPPNARAEVVDLISDIKSTYGYRIAVFDIGLLVRVTINIILFGKGIDTERLYELEGIVNVSDIEH